MKAYDVGATLDKSIARALVGTIVDLNPGAVIESVKVELRAKPGTPITLYRDYLGMWLLTTASVTAETARYLDAYGIRARTNVAPDQDEYHLDDLIWLLVCEAAFAIGTRPAPRRSP